MLGSRQRPSREERRAWWRRQLSRQQSTNLSVTEFCRQLGVSLTTFYYWKRRAQEAPPNVPAQGAAERRSRPMPSSARATAGDFLPVSILDPGVGTQLEIELANACLVRLRGPIDPSLLQAAITAAGELNGSRQQGAN
jgi:transposase-like protein